LKKAFRAQFSANTTPGLRVFSLWSKKLQANQEVNKRILSGLDYYAASFN